MAASPQRNPRIAILNIELSDAAFDSSPQWQRHLNASSDFFEHISRPALSLTESNEANSISRSHSYGHCVKLPYAYRHSHLELSSEAAAALDRLVQNEHRAPSDVVNDLLLGDEELREAEFTPEQWETIQSGLEDERAGRFVPHEQIVAMLNKDRGSH